jgi:hypothetical protein
MLWLWGCSKGVPPNQAEQISGCGGFVALEICVRYSLYHFLSGRHFSPATFPPVPSFSECRLFSFPLSESKNARADRSRKEIAQRDIYRSLESRLEPELAAPVDA